MKVRIRTDKESRVMLAIVDLDWHLYGKYEFVHTQDLTVGTNSYPSHHHQYEFVPDASRQYGFVPESSVQFVPNTPRSVRIRTGDIMVRTNSYPRFHHWYEFVP